jgi:hypothetical protein
MLTVLGWVALVVVLVAAHSAAGSAYTDKFTLPHTESFDAVHLLQRATPKTSGETDQLVIGVKSGKVTDPAVRARAEKLSRPSSRPIRLRRPSRSLLTGRSRSPTSSSTTEPTTTRSPRPPLSTTTP